MGVKVREKDGAWWIFIDHNKRRKAKRIGPGEAGRKAAKTVAAKIEARLTLGDLGILEAKDNPTPAPTFEAVAGEWERIASPNWKRGTAITYANALRCRILPTLGPLPMTDQGMTESVIEAWWTGTREAGLSRRRLAILRNIVHNVCKRAVRKGLLTKNPADCIEGSLGREDREIRKVDWLTGEDLARLLTTAQTVTPREYPMFLVMGTGGLRIGEAVGLQVGDLDTLAQQVHVCRMVRRGYVSSPKSGKGRTVALPASTVAVLEHVRQTRQAEAAYAGTEARWLFPGRSPDMPITPEQVQLALRKAARAAGIRPIHPHSLRHSYASLAIQAGVPLLNVSRQLGHASIAITADVYGHAVPGTNRAAADALEMVLVSNQTQPPRNPTA